MELQTNKKVLFEKSPQTKTILSLILSGASSFLDFPKLMCFYVQGVYYTNIWTWKS